jgi:anti-sigma regulatory factor (Ser/Thr protein kinase)
MPLEPIFSRHLRVEDESQVGAARREVGALCHDLGFNETRAAQAALIVTELATNLCKHTAGLGGELIFRPFEADDATGLDILSLDQGPGIANMTQSLRDGYSSVGSAGNGLGAINRLSSVFDFFSAPGKGCALFSRLWKDAPPALSPVLSVGAVCLPVHGEQACGDAWAMRAGRNGAVFMLADGLGHGPDAAAAAHLAVSIFEKNALRSPHELLTLIHSGLRGTRGAAVVVAEISLATRVVRFAGVGNISALMHSGERSIPLISYNGTAGVEARKIRETSTAWPEDASLILHSDGIVTQGASLKEYPGLAHKEATLIAGVLFRDHQRVRDDSTVLIIQKTRASSAP